MKKAWEIIRSTPPIELWVLPVIGVGAYAVAAGLAAIF